MDARPDGGFFISLTLPEGVLTSTVRAEAAKRSLNLSDGLAFFPNGGGERFPAPAVLCADAGGNRRRCEPPGAVCRGQPGAEQLSELDGCRVAGRTIDRRHGHAVEPQYTDSCPR